MSWIRRNAQSQWQPSRSLDEAGRGGRGQRRAGTLSIVIPAKDEAANLAPLLGEIARAFRPLVGESAGGHRLDGFEVVIVDDGSTDNSVVSLDNSPSTTLNFAP